MIYFLLRIINLLLKMLLALLLQDADKQVLKYLEIISINFPLFHHFIGSLNHELRNWQLFAVRLYLIQRERILKAEALSTICSNEWVLNDFWYLIKIYLFIIKCIYCNYKNKQ